VKQKACEHEGFLSVWCFGEYPIWKPDCPLDFSPNRVWLKLFAVPMKLPLIREFERFTALEASPFFRNCQTSGFSWQSRGFT